MATAGSIYQLLIGRKVIVEGSQSKINEMWAESGGAGGMFKMRVKPVTKPN